jgi:hypothetical protein
MGSTTSIPLAWCQHQSKRPIRNSMTSNFSCPMEFWPLFLQPEIPMNELRSLQEQRRAWIKERGKINTGYSRRSEIMREYLKVKSCSQG